MDGTPRLRSAFPNTPRTSRRTPTQNSTPNGSNAFRPSPKLPDVDTLKSSQPDTAPLIPTEFLQPPSQRAAAFAVYGLVLFYHLYDAYCLSLDETESLWLFMKWVLVDAIFLFGLPSLRIPWLEWSSSTMMVLFLAHALLDGILMFRIPILGYGFMAITKVVFDQELALSERRVKAADILNNPSLILGRQIIHVLPEGSARLNPYDAPICLESSRSSQAIIPLQINQTQPTSIELIRYDLATSQNETIIISSRQASRLRKEAEKARSPTDFGALTLRHPVKKTGLYRLGRIIDETRMEVSHKMSETLVLHCPQARIKATPPDKCRGDLSNMSLEVEGTPPLKLKYRKTVNGEDRDVTFQSIQPDDFMSPLLRHGSSGSLVSASSPDLSWAAPKRISVPLNETLTAGGPWSYSVDEVTDVAGNVASYVLSDPEYETPRTKTPSAESVFLVHERPTAALEGHQPRRVLQVAKGQAVRLPIIFGSTGRTMERTQAHNINYLFTATDDLLANGDHSIHAQVKDALVANTDQQPVVVEPGLYTLQSVSTPHCGGEIIEPASFMIVNPPEPSVDLSARGINDRCADRPVGLLVEFGMTGTSPFEVTYKIENTKSRSTQLRTAHFDGPRGQLELKPDMAGAYKYTFTSVSDAIYKGIQLKDQILEQDVKPSVSAAFVSKSPRRSVCIDSQPEFQVKLQGEGPWDLEYELVHGGKRSKQQATNIETEFHSIRTDPLTQGGEYSLALVSVQDRQGCREALQQSIKIPVRHQRPKVGFGYFEGQRKINTLESKSVDLPLRLTGEGPWSLKFGFSNADDAIIEETQLFDENDMLRVVEAGRYELFGLRDSNCPGNVDDSAKYFDVSLIGRPQVTVAESELVERQGTKHVRNAVCEGEEDAIDVAFSGRPPFDVKYRERVRSDKGQDSIRNHALNVPLNSAQIKLDTAHSGSYEYLFSELNDYNYDHDARIKQLLTIEQRVHARPGASFAHPGKVYSSCHNVEDGSSDDQDTVAVKLSGQPPFTLEYDIELRSQAVSKHSRPRSITVSNIATREYSLAVPQELLQPGTSFLRLRRVRDANGCERLVEATVAAGGSSSQQPSNRVQVSVHDPPTIIANDPDRMHYCIGDRISYTVSGVAPFVVFYDFAGASRKANLPTSTFRRIAESAGNFTMTGVMDSASNCLAKTGGGNSPSMTKIIHPMPSVRVGKGGESIVDIHAGGETEISFDFGGAPPFEFTYTRSANVRTRDKRPGEVLETRTLTSEGKRLKIKAWEEGTYEVVAIKDAFCAYARPGMEGLLGVGRENGDTRARLKAAEGEARLLQ